MKETIKVDLRRFFFINKFYFSKTNVPSKDGTFCCLMQAKDLRLRVKLLKVHLR